MLKTVFKNIIILTLLLLLVSFQFSGDIHYKLVHEPSAIKTVQKNNLINEVISINFNKSSMIFNKNYTVVYGIGFDGKERAVWLDYSKDQPEPTIYHVIEPEISREQALLIVKQSNLIGEISYIGLSYYERIFNSIGIGTYWSVSDKNAQYVYIDTKSGDITAGNKNID